MRLRHLLILTFLVPGLSSAEFGQPYEFREVLPASSALPSSLAQSAHHRVEDEVRVEDGYYDIDVDSDLGFFSVRSLALLRRRIHEIRTVAQAVGQLETTDEEFFRSIRGRRGVGSDSVVDLLADPVGTAAQLADNFSSNLEQTLDGDYGIDSSLDTQTTSSDYGDPSLQKRIAANQLKLDVYSTNPVVQALLDRMAQARSSGRFGGATAMVNLADPEPSISKDPLWLMRVRALIKDRSAQDLNAYNEKRLLEMKLAPALVAKFSNHRNYSPTHRTFIVVYLDLLDGIASRELVVKRALTAQSESEALAHQISTRMLAHYHQESGRLAQLIEVEGTLAAITANDELVLFSTADLISWDEQTERLIEQFQLAGAPTGGREILTSGTFSAQAKEALSKRKQNYRERYSL